MDKSFKPDKKYFKKVLWMQLTISILIVFTIAIIHLIIKLTHGDPEVPLILWFVGILCILFMWIITSPIAYYWIKNLNYIVYDDRLKIHKGILTKTQQNIPFRAITDFAFERTIYDRILGIGSIKIQTAGQSHTPTGYEGKLSGLLEYDKWYSELREKVKSVHSITDVSTNDGAAKNTDAEILEQILKELKEIRKNTDKN